MSFLSAPFVLFLGVTLAAFQLSPARFRPVVLLAASYVFYASTSPSGALLLLGVTLAVHQAALAIERHRTEGGKLLLVGIAVAALTLLLAGFKLASALWPWTDAGPARVSEGVALRVLVPLGLSYYIFKLIGYLLDVYWEKFPAGRSVLALALYASFFPQIVTGPIERAGTFFDQLGRTSELQPASVEEGARRILFGLFKKIAVADRVAVVVDSVHAKPGTYSSLELLLGAYLFALQLYADFSGVTDIAIGLGQLFGIKGPENFDLPFFSRNLQVYWRRWHMSLTSWLADYLFTPLRMALRDLGSLGLALAIVVNMVAIGVWHGMAWTYAAFGLLHGIFMVVSVFTLKKRDAFFSGHPLLSRVRGVTAPVVTFHLVVLALVVFRASSISRAVEYLTRLATGAAGIPLTRLDFRLLNFKPSYLLGVLVLAAIMEFVNWAMRQPTWSRAFLTAPRVFRWAIYYGIIFMILAIGNTGQQKFIYAQF
ncbi:MAG TPA: MBOAT family O-acyltransferase [Anaeromyxobacteraceae bacterium]|nr:MBOAT family O-acyltransferase [Anaeromyxobacteraceae bacterium]